jgi:predicted N-acetyltransferase YhbS
VTRADVHVSIAPPREHAALNAVYLRLGYHGGIADDDVVFVAHVNDQPVGLVRRSVESGLLMLRGMQVAPEHQRQGIGSRLLRAFVADLPATDCYCIPYAHLPPFYAQGGFALLDESGAADFLRARLERYRAEGLEVVVMRRDATPDGAACPLRPSALYDLRGR